MTTAAGRARKVLMVGYPKRYDGGYTHARQKVQQLEDLRLVRVTTLEAPFLPYVAHHRLVDAQDIDPAVLEDRRAESDERIADALGTVDAAREEVRRGTPTCCQPRGDEMSPGVGRRQFAAE